MLDEKRKLESYKSRIVTTNLLIMLCNVDTVVSEQFDAFKPNFIYSLPKDSIKKRIFLKTVIRDNKKPKIKL